MQEVWDKAYPLTAVYEGGYVNHPADPGGATNYGVTQRVWDADSVARGVAKTPVRSMSRDNAKRIFKKQYWDAANCDAMPGGVDFVVFDGAVNSGVTQSVKWLQRALLDLGLYGGPIDGQAGTGTFGALALVDDYDILVSKITARRLAFCRALRTWPTFGKGWGARIASVQKNGQAFATGTVGPAPFWVDGMDARAVIEHAKPIPSFAVADVALAGGGGGGLSVSGVVETIRQQVEPLAGALPALGYVVTACAITGALCLAGGGAYRWYLTRKAKSRADVLDLPTGVAAA